MSYYAQLVIASYITLQGIEVIVHEGLNTKDKWELRLVIPKHLWSLYEDSSRFVYDKIGTMYFATDSWTGRVRYFHYSEPGYGFGGSIYRLPMKDGSIAELKGPWSSNSHAMNRAGHNPSMEVNIHGKYNMADAMTINEINHLLQPLEMEVVLIEDMPYIIRL